MNQQQYQKITDEQKSFFFAGATKEISFRVKQLKILRKAIESAEAEILKALRLDLGRSETESYVSEIASILKEINFALKNVKKWNKPKKARTPFMLFPASSYIYQEPYGRVLIIGPWNYPFELLFMPLIGSITAGNCSVVKPSEMAPNCSRVIASTIKKNFDQSYIAVAEGGAAETQALLEQRFDYIFFTGGTRVGKIIMESAAKHLTPITLELGGKCPCIVDKEIDMKTTARRIAWGKFFNAGQTCVAPDYLLVHKFVKNELLKNIKTVIKEFYGEDSSRSKDYGRIINERHFSRLSELLNEGNVIIGGNVNKNNLYIAPTVIDNISWNSKIMEDEIFGPILPVIEYENLDEIISILYKKPKPLALYFFSKDKYKQEKILKQTSSGGVSINDTMAHIENTNLPFGGVGDSGVGAYHGKASFDTFSRNKSVVKRSFFENKMKYPPYKTPLKYLKKVMRIIG